jgi:hypothetical protein
LYRYSRALENESGNVGEAAFSVFGVLSYGTTTGATE